MAAKHDQSKNTSESSSVTNTTTTTENISDSYNKTNSIVNSLDNVGNYNIFAGGEGMGASAASALGIDSTALNGGIDWKKTGIIAAGVVFIAIVLGMMFRK